MDGIAAGAPYHSNEATGPLPRAPRVPMNKKLKMICALIDNLNLTPKSFIIAFLEQDDDSMAFKRRLWATDQGWDSTEALLLAIKHLCCSHVAGRALWEEFILSQAIEIVSAQRPVSGMAPQGSYHTSATLSDAFFTKEERDHRNTALINRMPFLYRLLCSKLQGNMPGEHVGSVAPQDPVQDDSDDEHDSDPSEELVDYDGSVLKTSKDPATRRAIRVQTLSNALLFLAGGVTERVSGYLNYIGISSSRRTAHAALKSLGAEAQAKIEALYCMDKSPLVAPMLCYDNLDFQEKIHMKSLGHSSKMFHGTWGYVHTIPPILLSRLDPSELTVEALNTALHLGKELKIRPDMFAPTPDSTIHFEKTLKSQITQVILKYFATPTDKRVELQKSPPEVNPITSEDPNITMLKLMLASDNSALGVGEVFTGVIQQSGLKAADFHSRLQIVEGDLGSCNIFDSLRKQRTPALGDHNSLDNILPIPGAAHTLWNLAQAIYLGHWGNEKLARDTGAWRTLHALGIPTEKPVTKKDFNLMLSHVEKIHEATLLYFVL
ncbi:hypothetical protein PGTUg99_017615 [Puccinia graminis f. sp. tritici]|uniref:DUF6589 domain-containing protein n=1 Tax=Puccinia graminis f. sp. tritici TaxID=56615 RepID=A0A5B0M4C1_PUCGR|nr:hypothetical protein PGTUg99_017615 [Puccinia graminis f. sp. tritici]